MMASLHGAGFEAVVTDKKRVIIASQEGVRLTDAQGKVLWQVPWSAVKEIAAWKDDAWAYDIICFGFRIDERGYYSCDEENEGWDSLQAILKSRFGITLEQWFDKVAFPAFAKNYTSLWIKPES